MRLAIHLGRIVFDAISYGINTRRLSVLVIIVLGLLALAVSTATKAVAPLALYPFA